MAKKNKRKISNDKQIQTFTKKWVNRILWFGCIWITWSYILASFDKVSIAEALSETVVKVIIATVLGYLLKSFFGKYFEEKNIIYKQEHTDSDIHEDDDVVDDEDIEL